MNGILYLNFFEDWHGGIKTLFKKKFPTGFKYNLSEFKKCYSVIIKKNYYSILVKSAMACGRM